MPKYMYSGNYTEKGVAGLLKDGGKARHKEAEKSAEAMGGSLEAYYWAYGTMDFLMIVTSHRKLWQSDSPSTLGHLVSSMEN